MVSEFNPYELFEQLKENDLDPSIFDSLDENQFPKAPNFLEFAIGPQFLNTRILPKQIEIGTKLLADYCPHCSNPGYIDKLYDQSIGNIKDNIQFLTNGKCPKCGKNRWELIKEGSIVFHSELAAACGQRCIPKDSYVYTRRGLVPINQVKTGDQLTHGINIGTVQSGKLKPLKITTKYNYSMIGAKETHIVPVLRQDRKWPTLTRHQRQTRKWKQEIKIEYIHMKDCQVGDMLLLQMPDMWAKERYVLPKISFKTHPNSSNTKKFDFPNEVTPELARFLGYLIADGNYNRKYNVRICTSNPDTEADLKRCSLAVFGEEPQLEEDRGSVQSWSLNGIEIVEWLKAIGLQLATGRQKKIPDCILQSPKEIVCEFIAGLFGADGNVYKEKNDPTIRIQYTSVSKTLIKQLRLLLLNMGIVTRCDKNESPSFGKSVDYSIEPEEGKESYFLSTKSAEFVEIFKQNIHLVEKKKIAILAQNKPSGKTRYHTPYGMFEYSKYAKWPQSLQLLAEKKYFAVPIEKIEEMDAPIEMMDVQIPDTNIYTAEGFVHHNSGKSKLAGLIANYVNHLMLKVSNPLRLFNQPTGEVLIGTFSGLTQDQTMRNLWNPFKGFMDASPWFQNYHKFLKDEGRRIGVELIRELQTSLTYAHKNLHWNSTGSEGRKMRGDTRFFAAIDELGWMNSDESKQDQQFMNADAVYTALANSLTTMRTKYKNIFDVRNYDLPPILMCNISSPSSAKDKIMRLNKDAKKNTRILALNIPTWDMNPDYTYQSLREEFSHMDAEIFMRDFGAEPPLAANPYISDPKVVDKVATGHAFQGFEVKEIIEKDPQGDDYKTVKLVVKKGDKITPRMVTFDLGSKKNGLAVCVFSIDVEGKIKLDFALNIMPEKTCRINIAKFYEDFTVPLIENFKVKHALFDRWQSLDQVERLKIAEVDARIHSLKYAEMESVRGALVSQAVVIPSLEKPMTSYIKDYLEDEKSIAKNHIASLGIQLLTVRDLGHRMAKPLLGDDDIFRAFCLGVVKMSDPKIKDTYLAEPLETKSGHRMSFLGTVRSLSDRGNSYGGMGYVEGDDGRIIGSVRTRYQR